jgi:hypothetical protein
MLLETLRVTGLDQALSAGLKRWRKPRAIHDPGKIVADLAVTLALGGDCPAGIAMLRADRGAETTATDSISRPQQDHEIEVKECLDDRRRVLADGLAPLRAVEHEGRPCRHGHADDPRRDFLSSDQGT